MKKTIDVSDKERYAGTGRIRGEAIAPRAFTKKGKSGAVVYLPPLPGGGDTEASGVNSCGWIVGRAKSSNGVWRPVIWTKATCD